MRLGYGTVVRAYRKTTVALLAVQNPKAGKLQAVSDAEYQDGRAV